MCYRSWALRGAYIGLPSLVHAEERVFLAETHIGECRKLCSSGVQPKPVVRDLSIQLSRVCLCMLRQATVAQGASGHNMAVQLSIENKIKAALEPAHLEVSSISSTACALSSLLQPFRDVHNAATGCPVMIS